MLHDCRVDSTLTRAQGTLQLQIEFTDIQCHPIMEHIFVTSTARGHVCLRDSRMTFGPLSRRTKEGVVQEVSDGILIPPYPSCLNLCSTTPVFPKHPSTTSAAQSQVVSHSIVKVWGVYKSVYTNSIDLYSQGSKLAVTMLVSILIL